MGELGLEKEFIHVVAESGEAVQGWHFDCPGEEVVLGSFQCILVDRGRRGGAYDEGI